MLTFALQSRPHTVSQHWSAALGAEWQAQALLEQQLSLPVSVQMTDEPIAEAKVQVGFITNCTSPLFQLTAVAVPGRRISLSDIHP